MSIQSYIRPKTEYVIPQLQTHQWIPITQSKDQRIYNRDSKVWSHRATACLSGLILYQFPLPTWHSSFAGLTGSNFPLATGPLHMLFPLPAHAVPAAWSASTYLSDYPSLRRPLLTPPPVGHALLLFTLHNVLPLSSIIVHSPG